VSSYLKKHVETKTPQTEQESPLQVPNSAGGFSFSVTPIDRLMRFLILGSEGGTYYVGEKDLTKENLDNLKELTQSNPFTVIHKAALVSDEGRAYRNDAAIFVLAYVMTFGDDKAKAYARGHVNVIVRTATHLFQYESFLKALAPGSGLGTSRNKSIADWYGNKTPEQIAYQAVKYRNRYGWTHKDSLRQSRPKFHTDLYDDVAKWILGKYTGRLTELPTVIQAFEEVQKADNVENVLAIMEGTNLPWESLPTHFHKEPKVWKKLFYTGQLKGQALVRNIIRLARMSAFDDLVFARDYADKLVDEEMIKWTRLHPLNFLNALVVHTEGQIQRKSWSFMGYRNKDWISVPVIVDALNAGVHLSFKHVEPTGKRTLLAVDVSGSMSGSIGMGLDLTAAQISGVMAATIAKTEPYYQIMGFSHQFRDLGISADMSLTSVMKKVQDNNFGSTNCSMPMIWAMDGRTSNMSWSRPERHAVKEFDTFVVLTDSETYASPVHPHVALQDYRKKTGIPAKLIVVGTTSTGFTIADPNDSGMLDCVGADANLPRLIAEFSKGYI